MKNLRDSYKYYKKNYENPIDIKNYLILVGEYNKFLIDKVLEGEEVTLPARMGTLKIKGKKERVRFVDGKVRGLAPDWVKTKQLWDSDPESKAQKKLIYHTNPHTQGIRYRYVWRKKRIIVSNSLLYSLRLTRTNKRAVYRRIMDGKEYI